MSKSKNSIQSDTNLKEIKTHYRACHLCEAICGLEIKTRGDKILSIRGDVDDPFSRGYICPKGTALEDLHTDPDRLRTPVKKVVTENGDIEWQEISWQQAIDETASRLVDTQSQYGTDSVGFYAGNPNVHNYGNMTHGGLLRRAVGSKNNFSATSLDQLPHQLAALKMYGHQFFVPIPDVDHCDFLIVIGGNPLASNGSMMTMPDARGRLKALAARGKLIVIDPRKTETAEIANQHHFIKPGSDAFLLLAMINCQIENGWVKLGELSDSINAYAEVVNAVKPFSLSLAEEQTGIAASVIKVMAEQLATTKKSACYGRMGVSVQEFGGICQWAIQILNIFSGSMDQEGGMRITSPAFASVGPKAQGKGHFDRFQSRVSGLPEFGGELPAAVMAEEIETEGDGQIKAMVSIAGNPVSSSVDALALDKAFSNLDFYVAIDFYINETTRHADIILPPSGAFEHDHYDIAFLRLAVRNVTRFNEAVFEKQANALHDWEIYNQLAAKISELKDQAFKPMPAPDKLIALGIEQDMWSDKYNPTVALTLDKIRENPHGIDLGPLQAGMLERLCTDDQKINLAPQIYLDDLPRLLTAARGSTQKDELLLIGRRHVRSNNSWMHNFRRLVKGKPRWALMMNPNDLAERGLEDGSEISINSKTGTITTFVESSDTIMPGVVCLPHGWGQQKIGVRLSIATEQNGANYNDLTDAEFIDKLSGNAALNGLPVKVSAA